MSETAPGTVAEKVVLAGFALEEDGESPFTAEALIVTAWRKFPDTFGLRYYSELYPDSNKVLASIMGRRGLTKRGWFVKVGQKQYELTHDGRQVARRLLYPDQEPEPEPTPKQLTDAQDRLMQRLLSCSAVEKCQQKDNQGGAPDLTFVDACRFWGITESLQNQNVDDRLEQLEIQLGEIDRFLGTASLRLRDGRTIQPDDVTFLGNLHTGLTERFQRHLNLLRHRTLQAS